MRRHLIDQDLLQKALKNCQGVQLGKPTKLLTLRHSFGTHVLESWQRTSTAQALLGHSDFPMMMIYTHVLNERGYGPTNPMERL